MVPPPQVSQPTAMCARPSRGEPTDLGSLLSATLSQREWQGRLWLHQVFLFWDEVVGREVARHAQPQVIRNDVLWLAVSDSMWMQQLQFERHYLLQAVNERLAAGPGAGGQVLALADLKFQLEPSLKVRERPPDRRPATSPLVDQEALRRFSGSLCAIADPELRQAMQRLWLALHRTEPDNGDGETNGK